MLIWEDELTAGDRNGPAESRLERTREINLQTPGKGMTRGPFRPPVACNDDAARRLAEGRRSVQQLAPWIGGSGLCCSSAKCVRLDEALEVPV